VTGSDYGTWRRLLVYNFKKTLYPKGNPLYDPANPLHGVADTRVISDYPGDPNYQEAYFSILVHYYEIFRDRYGCNIDEVPHERIRRETRAFQNQQDTMSRFLTERLLTTRMLEELRKEADEKAARAATRKERKAQKAAAGATAQSEGASATQAEQAGIAGDEAEEEAVAKAAAKAPARSRFHKRLRDYEALFDEQQRLPEVATLYQQWLASNVRATTLSNIDIQKDLGRTELRKYIKKTGRGDTFLEGARILPRELFMPELPSDRVAELKEKDAMPPGEQAEPIQIEPVEDPDEAVLEEPPLTVLPDAILENSDTEVDTSPREKPSGTRTRRLPRSARRVADERDDNVEPLPITG
jgi:hypothetical protein